MNSSAASRTAKAAPAPRYDPTLPPPDPSVVLPTVPSSHDSDEESQPSTIDYEDLYVFEDDEYWDFSFVEMGKQD